MIMEIEIKKLPCGIFLYKLENKSVGRSFYGLSELEKWDNERMFYIGKKEYEALAAIAEGL